MKKLATLMLGMSFLVGAAAFAQDASTQPRRIQQNHNQEAPQKA